MQGMHDLEAAECELLDVGAAMERRQLLVVVRCRILEVWAILYAMHNVGMQRAAV